MYRKWENPGHEFDQLGKVLGQKKYVVLYGNPDYVLDLYSLCDFLEEKNLFELIIINKNEEWQEKGFNSHKVLPPESVVEIGKDSIFVVCTINPDSQREIVNYLESNNVDQRCITTGRIFIKEYLSIYLVYKKNITFFNTICLIPSTLCNLNCKNCLNFTPYIKEHIIESFDSLMEDIDAFFSYVDYIYDFEIGGGEPFLFKDLGKIITYIGKYYRNRILKLKIITNGTVVPSDELCTLLEKYNVDVLVDDYRENVPFVRGKFEKVVQKLEEKKVSFAVGVNEKWIKLYPMLEEEKYSEEELCKKYYDCDVEWAVLNKKEITNCNYMNFAAKAGLVEYDNAFKLGGEINKKELVEYRLRYRKTGYGEFCKICRGYIGINHDGYMVAEQV